MKNAMKLIKDIEKKINVWDEYSSFTIKGVKNLSYSDLDILKLYANEYITSGGVTFNGLMEPTGDIKKVLDSYNIKVKSYF